MPSDLRHLWCLDPHVTFLNHGSFGACPRPVVESLRRWQDEIEREPVEFLARRLEGHLHEARRRLAAFVGSAPENLAFVANATTGVNAVLRSLSLGPGDEILLADHSYNAVKQAVRHLCDRRGVGVATARIPFPISSPGQVVDAFAEALSPRTRLVVVDHVTSPTALILPVAEIVALARDRGVPVLVDGAHGPALLPLELDALGADFYTGNLHKWLCAPRGAAFLHAASAWHAELHALSISHGYGLGLHAEFDWTGTIDPSAWLAVPDAIDFFDRFGFDAVRAHNHALVRDGRERVAEALGVELPHPDDPRLYGPMAVVPFPRAEPADFMKLVGLTRRLYEEHRIEVPFTAYDERVWVRISAQLYNAPEDYERLAEVLREWRP